MIYRAQQTTSSIRATNLQVKKTLESYNYIVEGKAQDPRAEYKKLVKDIGKCGKSRDDVRVKAENMQKAADAFFMDWQESLAGYNSDEMRAKSEGRMAETQANYDKIFEAGTKAADDFDSFIAALDDQVRYLGNDLNPSAIASSTTRRRRSTRRPTSSSRPSTKPSRWPSSTRPRSSRNRGKGRFPPSFSPRGICIYRTGR